MNWKSKNVLVTGGTGFVGSWLVERLNKLGANVVCVIRDKAPYGRYTEDKINDGVAEIYGDITNLQLMERALNEYDVEHVFHLAAQAIVQRANKNPLGTWDTNVRGTWTLLEAARNFPELKSFVVASSDKAYGNQEVLPYTEETPLQGRYPYDASKSCADIISQSYFYTYGTPVTITRCGNIYGGGDLNWDRITPSTILSLHRNEAPSIRSDGKSVREYIYVEDVVDAYLTLAENTERKDVKGQAFNFGSKKPLQVLELVNEIIKAYGKNIKPKVLNIAKNEIQRQTLSVEKCERILKWKAKYSLEDGLKKTVSWYKAYFSKHPKLK